VSTEPASLDLYIQSSKLDNSPLERCWIPWETITRGGTLDLTLGDQPKESWGR